MIASGMTLQRAAATWLMTCLIAVGVVAGETTPEDLTAEQNEFFESSIRPIFVNHCYACHSSEAEDVEGGLLLDSKWGWETGGDSGPAVVPGEPDESLVMHAVRYQEDVVSAMPPKSKLAQKDIELLERWVEMGAPDPRPKPADTAQSMVESFDLQKRLREHWSWRPVVTTPLPAIENASWPRRVLDHYILAKIEAAGLKPARPADRATWIRRVYFDLIGLPPTPDQISEFVNDPALDAHEHVVNELLDSQHFGEKWARHWMDLVRYADTYGHEFDYPIDRSFEYRDYLIRALNADVPYDQLVREHIAGDLLPEPRRHPTDEFNESIIGTGFWYLHEATHAPTDVLGNEADIIDNQLDVFGKAFLGLTVACARCHDHKFDAISTADYYALSAYLQSSCRQLYPLDPGRRIEIATDKIERLRDAVLSDLRQTNVDAEPLRPGRYFDAATRLLVPSREMPPTDPQIDAVAEESELDPNRLRTWVRVLTSADLDARPVTAEAVLAMRIRDPQRIDPLVERVTADQRRVAEFDETSTLFADFNAEQLPPGWSTSGLAFAPTGKGLGVAIDAPPPTPGTIDSGVGGRLQSGILRSPTFTINSEQIHVRMRATANVTINVIIDNYQMASFSALLFKGTLISGGKSDTQGQWQWKTFAGDLKKYLGHNAYLEVIDRGDAVVAIDEVRFSRRGAVSPAADALAVQLFDGGPSLDRLWEESLTALRSGRDHELLQWLIEQQLLSIGDLSASAADKLEQAAELARQLPQPRYVLAMAEGTTENARIYVRGSHTSLGREVPPRFLEALKSDPGNRLDLAHRTASPDNPLVSRVMVNRVWHHLFGRGIVATVDDFGPQGARPTHGELLDRLAHDFMRQGWSIKQLVRDIVLSQTYLQSSVANPELDRTQVAEVDPRNSLLHRMRVRRLPAESIRDAILAVSGRLDPQMYGAGVATHRNEFMTGRGARDSGPLDGAGRRSVYQSIYRNFLSPFMLTFDMPSPFGPKGRRGTSNVPAQALTLMNDPFVITQAQVWADAVQQSPESDRDQRITGMVQAAHGVTPTDEQINAYSRFLDQQATAYGGETDRRVWADLAHALWNMKAFYYLR